MILSQIHVAPLAGAWIEIVFGICYFVTKNVAPLAGAWIEILEQLNIREVI